MTMVQSGVGKVRIFEDFFGAEQPVANTQGATTATPFIGGLRMVGETIADTDTGIVSNETTPCLSGVARLTSPDGTADDHIGLVTAKMFDVGLMGTLIAETRVQFDDLDTKEFFFGFACENDDDQGLEGDLIHGGTETLTLTAADLCGFLLSSELTEDEMWHCAYNGGTTAGETDSTEVESGVDAVLAEWNILRVEIDPNGTARWFVDGVLKQTVEGAVSTTENLAGVIIVENKTTGAVESVDVDYVLFEANRDWTI
jgi:hypothetical protein